MRDLVHLVNVHLEETNHHQGWDTFVKKVMTDQIEVQYRTFCVGCLTAIKERAQPCGVAECKIKGKSTDQFLYCPIYPQFKRIMEGKIVCIRFKFLQNLDLLKN